VEQVWGMRAAEYYGIDNVIFFSGGTEASAYNLRAAEALKRQVFNTQNLVLRLKIPIISSIIKKMLQDG